MCSYPTEYFTMLVFKNSVDCRFCSALYCLSTPFVIYSETMEKLGRVYGNEKTNTQDEIYFLLQPDRVGLGADGVQQRCRRWWGQTYRGRHPWRKKPGTSPKFRRSSMLLRGLECKRKKKEGGKTREFSLPFFSFFLGQPTDRLKKPLFDIWAPHKAGQ